MGQAISYRFKRDVKGWRVFVSTEMMDMPVVTDRRRGAIGVDLNADHLAVAKTDASGNYLKAWRVPLVTYSKSAHQAEALIGDAVASVVGYAREAGKPIVMENSTSGKRSQLWRAGPAGPPGCGLGAGPSLSWLFGAHPASMGSTHGQWRAGRLHRTREETREARVDVLGRGIGTAETGACSAAPAGETQSGSGCSAGGSPRDGLSGDQLGVPG